MARYVGENVVRLHVSMPPDVAICPSQVEYPSQQPVGRWRRGQGVVYGFVTDVQDERYRQETQQGVPTEKVGAAQKLTVSPQVGCQYKGCLRHSRPGTSFGQIAPGKISLGAEAEGVVKTTFFFRSKPERRGIHGAVKTMGERLGVS